LLRYSSPLELKQEPDARRFWILAIMMCLRDKSTRLEVRVGEGDATVYQRTQGRDWELSAVDEELFPELKPTLREVSRLVTPERPEFTVVAGLPEGRVEKQEVGWLTFEVDQHLLDIVVRIDPREPYGFLQLDFEYPDEMELSGVAGMALADYYEFDIES
jgi:hypothetical protein